MDNNMSLCNTFRSLAMKLLILSVLTSLLQINALPTVLTKQSNKPLIEKTVSQEHPVKTLYHTLAKRNDVKSYENASKVKTNPENDLQKNEISTVRNSKPTIKNKEIEHQITVSRILKATNSGVSSDSFDVVEPRGTTTQQTKTTTKNIITESNNKSHSKFAVTNVTKDFTISTPGTEKLNGTDDITTEVLQNTQNSNEEFGTDVPDFIFESANSSIKELETQHDSISDKSVLGKKPTQKKYIVIERKRGAHNENDSALIKTSGIIKEPITEQTITTNSEVTSPNHETKSTDIQNGENFASQSNKSIDILKENTEEPSTMLELAESKGGLATKATVIDSTLRSIDVTDLENSRLDQTENSMKHRLSSIRGGYLDHSPKVADEEERTTARYIESSRDIKSEIFRPLFEINAAENDQIINKKINRIGSQIELDDDAIKEELLREESISHFEDINRHRNKIINENFASTIANESFTMSQEATTEDELRVKPISKNTKLYAVKTNYKPLKKLEILPPKPFIRDPDDNSWRNESLSSLGIVFNGKNSSKPLTQVLKNKTEDLLKTDIFPDNDIKNETLVLRERLEKLAEMRRRKKTEKSSEVIDGDYEEFTLPTFLQSTPTSYSNLSPMPINRVVPLQTSTVIYTEIPKKISSTTQITSTEAVSTTTEKPKAATKMEDFTSTTSSTTYKNLRDYYDESDDSEEVTLPDTDIKKFTKQIHNLTLTTFAPLFTSITKTLNGNLKEASPATDRKPTIQYFPPLKEENKEKVNHFNFDFERGDKLSIFKDFLPFTSDVGENAPVTSPKEENELKNNAKEFYSTDNTRGHQKIPIYITGENQNHNRASDMLKHYKDIVGVASKEADFETNQDYVPSFTKSPASSISTFSTIFPQLLSTPMEGVRYESKSHENILEKFKDNFNQNSKVDFPILYNTRVIHKDNRGHALASSSAFVKQQYGDDDDTPKDVSMLHQTKQYDPNNEKTPELSPAYDLHYYVPEQEETDDPKVEPSAGTDFRIK